jgi:hypothetical protein
MRMIFRDIYTGILVGRFQPVVFEEVCEGRVPDSTGLAQSIQGFV